MRTELVTTLKRKASELLADIGKDGAPILITQHGLPAAYLVDAVFATRTTLYSNASDCSRASPEVRRRSRTVAS